MDSLGVEAEGDRVRWQYNLENREPAEGPQAVRATLYACSNRSGLRTEHICYPKENTGPKGASPGKDRHFDPQLAAVFDCQIS